MKGIQYFILIFLISCSGDRFVDDSSTIENLGKTVFHALKSEDGEMFLKHCMTDDDVVWLAANSENPDPQGMRFDKDVLSRLTKNPSALIQKLRAEFAEKGLIDWSQARFSRVTYNDATRGTVTGANQIKIYFTTEDGLEGRFSMPYSFSRDGTWKIARLPKVERYRRM